MNKGVLLAKWNAFTFYNFQILKQFLYLDHKDIVPIGSKLRRQILPVGIFKHIAMRKQFHCAAALLGIYAVYRTHKPLMLAAVDGIEKFALHNACR